jgi:hypothetical protein
MRLRDWFNAMGTATPLSKAHIKPTGRSREREHQIRKNPRNAKSKICEIRKREFAKRKSVSEKSVCRGVEVSFLKLGGLAIAACRRRCVEIKKL